MAETLAQTHPPRGDRLAIVTNGGGLGVLAADALAEEGGRLAELAPTTLKQLDKKMPRAWSHGNPLDIIGDATPERYTEALAVIGADPQIDAVLVLHCPVATASSLAVAEAVVAARRAFRVPLLVSWVGGRSMMRSRRLFARSGIPCFAEPAEAIHAFMQLVRYRRNQELLMETPPSPSEVLQCNTEAAAAVIARALNEHRAWLDAGEVKTVLGAYGIPTVATATVADPDQAAQTAARIEGPVALKIASPDISHKSEVGGVILDLHGPAQVRAAALGMQADLQRRLPSARLSGFTVQPMVRWPQAFELIIGMASDELFGPVVLFGHGGTAVEVIGDKTLALPPLNLALARAMIERTRVGRLLGGYRDQPAADREAIALTLLKVAQIAADQPHIAELDINPLLASATGVIALDARIRVSADVVAGPDRLAIKPYPKHLEEPITLADGRRLCLRPIRAEDEPALVRGFERLDPEEIRLRFHHPMKTLDHRLAARLTQIDYDREMALILVEPQTGDIVAVARVNADPDRSRAEYAIIVSKPYTGLGLGFLLMERIITYARNEGIGEIFGNVLQDNEAMLALNRKLGFHLDHEPGELGVVRVSLKLQKPS
ncbi:MAG: GNAT family N-acetyltransferase [Gammaproteobacteria bacterium]